MEINKELIAQLPAYTTNLSPKLGSCLHTLAMITQFLSVLWKR